MRYFIAFLFLILSATAISQISSFEITRTVVSIGGETSLGGAINPYLKVENLGGGEYDVGIKDESTGYYIFVTVKYDRIDDSIYVYRVIKYDYEFREVKYVGCDVKLSDMSNGKRGDIIFYFNEDNYMFFSTK